MFAMLMDPALSELPFVVYVEPDPWPPIVVQTA